MEVVEAFDKVMYIRPTPITVNNFVDLFICTPVGRASDLMMAPAQSFQLCWLGPGDLSLIELIGVQMLDFCCSSVSKLFPLSDES